MNPLLLGDGCSGIGAMVPVGYNEAMGCYASFGMGEGLAARVNRTLQLALPLYIYGDITEAPPEPVIGPRADIAKDLARIASREYTWEWQFHTELSGYFNGLGDGHYTYVSGCFSRFEFIMPLPLVVEGAQVRVVRDLGVDPKILRWYLAQGIHVSRFLGARILAIEGGPPLQYLDLYSRRHVGTSKDANARLQLTLARTIHREGRWGISYGAFFSTRIPPAQGALKFTLQMDQASIDYVVPYVARVASRFNSSKAFYRGCSEAPVRTQRLDMRSHDHLLTPMSKEYRPKLADPKFHGQYFNLYSLGNSTAALTINTFQPTDTEAWIREAITWIAYIRANNFTGLIIDVSDATGTNMCLTYQLLDYLFPDEDNSLLSDMRHCPVTSRLGGPFNESNYHRPKQRHHPPQQAKPGPISLYRGRSDGLYSTLLVDNCDGHDPHYRGFTAAPPIDWKKLFLLTNSACFEACSVFATVLREVHAVRTYTHTLFPDSKLPSAMVSMPSTHQTTVALLQAKLQDLRYLPPFPVPVAHAIPLREFYSTDYAKLRPLMFTSPRTTHAIPLSLATSLDSYQVWKHIAWLYEKS